jgi:hypothetical protein
VIIPGKGAGYVRSKTHYYDMAMERSAVITASAADQEEEHGR